MFCPNCGTKNDDDALFCGECGTRLAEEMPEAAANIAQQTQDMTQQYYTPVQPAAPVPQPNEKKPFKVNKLVVATIILAVVFVASIAAFVTIGKNTYSAKKVATDYFNAIKNCDWDTAYDMMDISESEFINKDLFIKAMSDYTSDEEITKYMVSVQESDIEAVATVTYRVKGEDYNDDYNFVMNRQNKKNFLIFDSWKVSPKTFISKNIQVAVPNGAELYMDGKAVDESYISDESDDYTTYYVIPKLFNGYHTFNIAVGDFESDVEKYDVSYDGDYLSLQSINIDEKSQKEIIDTAYEYTTKLIDAAVSGQQFSTVQDLFAEDIQEDAAYIYENSFADDFYPYSKDDGITAVTLTDVTADIESYYITDGKLQVYITFDYHVKNDGVSKNWWTNELTNGTDEGDESSSVELIYEDGKWLIGNEYSFPSGVTYNTWFD